MAKQGLLEQYHKFSNDDPIARLIVHYFYPSDFVYRDYVRVGRALKAQKRRTRWRASQESCYMRLWLSTLFAVVEGYRSLNLHDEEIDSMLSEALVDSLRWFRNGTFHYQKSAMKQTQFLQQGPAKLAWAERLHTAFDRFFTDYRIDVTVRNFMAAREPR